jgi:hypothetical protein
LRLFFRFHAPQYRTDARFCVSFQFLCPAIPLLRDFASLFYFYAPQYLCCEILRLFFSFYASQFRIAASFLHLFSVLMPRSTELLRDLASPFSFYAPSVPNCRDFCVPLQFLSHSTVTAADSATLSSF